MAATNRLLSRVEIIDGKFGRPPEPVSACITDVPAVTLLGKVKLKPV